MTSRLPERPAQGGSGSLPAVHPKAAGSARQHPGSGNAARETVLGQHRPGNTAQATVLGKTLLGKTALGKTALGGARTAISC